MCEGVKRDPLSSRWRRPRLRGDAGLGEDPGSLWRESLAGAIEEGRLQSKEAEGGLSPKIESPDRCFSLPNWKSHIARGGGGEGGILSPSSWETISHQHLCSPSSTSPGASAKDKGPGPWDWKEGTANQDTVTPSGPRETRRLAEAAVRVPLCSKPSLALAFLRCRLYGHDLRAAPRGPWRGCDSAPTSQTGEGGLERVPHLHMDPELLSCGVGITALQQRGPRPEDEATP